MECDSCFRREDDPLVVLLHTHTHSLSLSPSLSFFVLLTLTGGPVPPFPLPHFFKKTKGATKYEQQTRMQRQHILCFPPPAPPSPPPPPLPDRRSRLATFLSTPPPFPVRSNTKQMQSIYRPALCSMASLRVVCASSRFHASLFVIFVACAFSFLPFLRCVVKVLLPPPSHSHSFCLSHLGRYRFTGAYKHKNKRFAVLLLTLPTLLPLGPSFCVPHPS